MCISALMSKFNFNSSLYLCVLPFLIRKNEKCKKKCLTVWGEGGNINKLSQNGSPLDLLLPPHGSGQVIKKKKKGLDKESKVW